MKRKNKLAQCAQDRLRVRYQAADMARRIAVNMTKELREEMAKHSTQQQLPDRQ